MEELLTSEEVAQLLRRTTRFVRRLVASREIEYVKVGRGVRFTLQAVQEYKRRNTFAVLTRAEIRRSLAGV